MPRRSLILLTGMAAGILLAAAPASAQEGGPGRVYMTPERAFVEIFGEGVRVERDRGRLEPAEVRRIADASGSSSVSAGPVTHRVYRDGELLGYAMVVDERGKYRPITFMVGTDADFAVRGVEVLVYREDRGHEVHRKRFVRQYREKTLEDPIRTHRDIVNITGATISVASMNVGVRRAIATLRSVYGDAPPAVADADR